jgi:DNA-binding transcriptional ArsR family regulator
MTAHRNAAYSVEPDLAQTARLIGDPVRIGMLFALLDGRELPASELAFRAGASPQAASAHLHKLLTGGLLVLRRSGRQRLFALASPEVARVVEALASVAPSAPIVSLSQHERLKRLREARSCYDHLAGRLGVALMDAMHAGGVIAVQRNAIALTTGGVRFVRDAGIDLEALRGKRALVRACMDWTERRHHLAGSLGAALLARFLDEGWLQRNPSDRALRITAAGRVNFTERFGVSIDR